MPPTDSGFQLCIEHDGMLPCPPGPYQNSLVEYAGVADTRGCSSCTCGSPSGVTCGGTWTAYTDTMCQTEWVAQNGTPGQYTPPATCVGPSIGEQSVMYRQSATGGSCAASAVMPTGGVSPTGPVTLCCQ